MCFRTCRSVASALDYLHREKRILHGDMKSGNVLVIGDFKTVKICDFGVALRLDENLVVAEDEVFLSYPTLASLFSTTPKLKIISKIAYRFSERRICGH